MRAFAFLLLPASVLAAEPARLSGRVAGANGAGVAGAAVQVVGTVDRDCQTTTRADGSFDFTCADAGAYVVRASYGELQAWEIGDVVLEPGRTIELNFLLLPRAVAAAKPSGEVAGSWWSAPVPNPTLATWHGRAISLRLASAFIAGGAFVLGALTMMALGRRFGTTGLAPLAALQVGELILNPSQPAAGEHVPPVAVVGARSASAAVTYGADEIAAALAARRFGLVLGALLLAPLLFALATAAFAVALLIGQEVYLLLAMLLVPAGFLLTAGWLGVGALRRRASRSLE